MAARASASGVISFSLVSIPVKLYTAATSEAVSFRMITPEGNPIRQKNVDPVSEKEYSFKACSKGYEHRKGEFILFAPEELKALEAGDKGAIEIRNFVPEETVDFVSVNKSYYVKPDKGGDKGFKLLSMVMTETDKVAVGQWTSRGKEHLILIRPYKGGLILHTLFYKNEVRDYDDNCANLEFSNAEKAMAIKLVNQFSKPTFDAGEYRDQFSDRVLSAVEQKLAGNEITVATQSDVPSLDLFAALQASLDAEKKNGSKSKTKKKK